MPDRVQRELATFGHALAMLRDHAAQWLSRAHAEPVATWSRFALPPPLMQARIAWTEQRTWQLVDPPAAWLPLLAWFHLPALREMHERALRRSRYLRLRRVLPRVWMARAESLPPGAVLDRATLAMTTTTLAKPAGSYVVGERDLSGDVHYALVSWSRAGDGRIRMDTAAAC